MSEFETGKNFEEVADKTGLDEATKLRYVKYMRTRWPDRKEEMCLTGYAGEWSYRFKTKIEYRCSDSEGIQVLESIDSQSDEKK